MPLFPAACTQQYGRRHLSLNHAPSIFPIVMFCPAQMFNSSHNRGIDINNVFLFPFQSFIKSNFLNQPTLAPSLWILPKCCCYALWLVGGPRRDGPRLSTLITFEWLNPTLATSAHRNHHISAAIYNMQFKIKPHQADSSILSRSTFSKTSIFWRNSS